MEDSQEQHEQDQGMLAQQAEYQRQMMMVHAQQQASASAQAEGLAAYGVDPSFMVSRGSS
jgi:hypothetical protein